ncbi:MAG: type II toxin-antitoxin system RelE/ParE family toxin [bacterium]|nr:type II toxin-antitoxin system RelE/ParE family toxin [bacterium]
MEPVPRTLRYYETSSGRHPCLEWLRGLRDGKGRGIIHTRLRRVETGNLRDCQPVGEGVYELVIDFGPGYRVYFGEDGDTVVLLQGGDKGSQKADIRRAIRYWREYNA